MSATGKMTVGAKTDATLTADVSNVTTASATGGRKAGARAASLGAVLARNQIVGLADAYVGYSDTFTHPTTAACASTTSESQRGSRSPRRTPPPSRRSMSSARRPPARAVPRRSRFADLALDATERDRRALGRQVTKRAFRE